MAERPKSARRQFNAWFADALRIACEDAGQSGAPTAPRLSDRRLKTTEMIFDANGFIEGLSREIAPRGEMSAVNAVLEIAAATKSPSPGPVLDWGRTRYADASQRQVELVARRLTGKMGDTLVFTEHEPVFTIGLRAGAERHLVWNDAQLAQAGVEVAKTNRGGDITYHGPGQVVGYPIVSLATHKDLHAYLRFLEEVLINAVGSLGLAATRRPGLTGIWLGSRKVAAVGVAVKRWVTYHGFALNVNAHLPHFAGIVPCGISAGEGAVTSLQAEFGRELDLAEVKRVLAQEFWAALPRFLAAEVVTHPGKIVEV